MFFFTRCRISMCQGLGPKKHDEISEIDRSVITIIITTMINSIVSYNVVLCYIRLCSIIKHYMISYTYIYIYICIVVCTYIQICIQYIYIYIYIYIHTYIIAWPGVSGTATPLTTQVAHRRRPAILLSLLLLQLQLLIEF